MGLLPNRVPLVLPLTLEARGPPNRPRVTNIHPRCILGPALLSATSRVPASRSVVGRVSTPVGIAHLLELIAAEAPDVTEGDKEGCSGDQASDDLAARRARATRLHRLLQTAGR
eukprot:scaffold24008_cov124-Isochrysis_galbana.AAC.2